MENNLTAMRQTHCNLHATVMELEATNQVYQVYLYHWACLVLPIVYKNVGFADVHVLRQYKWNT